MSTDTKPLPFFAQSNCHPSDEVERLRRINKHLVDQVQAQTAVLHQKSQELDKERVERKKAEAALVKERIISQKSSELTIANKKLAKSLRTKDELLANLSYELRTPLNAILGKSETLLEELNGPITEKQMSSLHIIEESGRHLLELTDDILDLSKIEDGNTSLLIQPIQLDQLCEDSLQFVRRIANKKQIKLRANLTPHLHSCQADEHHLRQILINLLSNAVKFTPAGGDVGLNILYDANKGTVKFQVWDSGIGIASDDMAQIFQPFVQLDKSLARKHQGTGLGLPLVHRLTEMHGGSVSLESQEGVGSCFTVTLPLNPYQDVAHISELAKADQLQYDALFNRRLKNTAVNPPQILLIEEDEANIETYNAYFSVWGVEMVVVRSYMEALARTENEAPKLILMGVQPSEMDGVMAVRQLRQSTLYARVPIITLTALRLSGERKKHIAAGANEYLSKPLRFHELILTMEMLSTDGPLAKAPQ